MVVDGVEYDIDIVVVCFLYDCIDVVFVCVVDYCIGV